MNKPCGAKRALYGGVMSLRQQLWGKMSTVASGTGVRFNAFLTNLELTQAQKQAAIKRHSAIRTTLEKEFPGSVTFMAGSYEKKTAIRPPADLDIMLVLPYQFYERYNTVAHILYPRNTQSELLQEIKRGILKHYPLTSIKADRQVIVVNFIATFSVEIVPCFVEGQRYKTVDTNNGGSWKTVDPKGLSIRLSASNMISKGNTIRLIKMLKCWKRFCNVPLKSFHIELLAQEFLLTYTHRDKSSIYYDWMVRDFFTWLLSKYSLWGVTIFHPTTLEQIDVGTLWKTYVESAKNRAIKAIDFDSKGLPISAKEEWQKIFGTFYQG